MEKCYILSHKNQTCLHIANKKYVCVINLIKNNDIKYLSHFQDCIYKFKKNKLNDKFLVNEKVL